MTLSGSYSFSGTSGSVSCPSTVKLVLESSTVKEEEPEGEIESFSVAKPSECDVGGTVGSLCGTHSVVSVEQTGTATLNATEEDFTISGLSLDYKFSSCAVTSLRVAGSPTVSVDDASKIGSATFSAGSLKIFNSSGEETGTASAGGSATASPFGTFQLASDGAETEATAEEEATETEETALTPSTLTLNGGQWYIDHEGTETLVGSSTATGDVLSLAGPLKTTNAAGTFVSGPCNTTAVVTLWNEKEQATGEVNSFEIFGPCATSIPGCTIEEANASVAFPWHIDVIEDEVNITGAGFANKYGDGCTGVGIPPGVPLGGTGTATGEFDTETHCVIFEHSGDLTGPLGPVFIGGELCVTE